MSAIEQFSHQNRNRRAAERVRVAGTIAVVFGRGEGLLIDLSLCGAKIRHFSPVRRGAPVRVSFEWQQARFSATTEVLSSRVIHLGLGPSYESRIRFTFVDEDSQRVLATVVDQIAGRTARRWVANLRGWSDEAQSDFDPTPFPTNSFIRCRLQGNRWEIKQTSDIKQPADGFVLPAESADSDIQALCDHYSRGDEEERQLIRVMANAAIEQSQSKG